MRLQRHGHNKNTIKIHNTLLNIQQKMYSDLYYSKLLFKFCLCLFFYYVWPGTFWFNPYRLVGIA